MAEGGGQLPHDVEALRDISENLGIPIRNHLEEDERKASETMERIQPLLSSGFQIRNYKEDNDRTVTEALERMRLLSFEPRFRENDVIPRNGYHWIVEDYQARREDANSGWRISVDSVPFYNERLGYRMCGRIYFRRNSSGNIGHISVFLVLIKGLYDKYLQWPFKMSSVSIGLLSQKPNVSDITEVVQPNQYDGTIDSEIGFPDFVSIDTLERDFVNNNSFVLQFSLV